MTTSRPRAQQTAEDSAKQQALEDGRSSNDAMQGILRNEDPLKCELLEPGELKRLVDDDVVTEVALACAGKRKRRPGPRWAERTRETTSMVTRRSPPSRLRGGHLLLPTIRGPHPFHHGHPPDYTTYIMQHSNKGNLQGNFLD